MNATILSLEIPGSNREFCVEIVGCFPPFADIYHLLVIRKLYLKKEAFSTDPD